MGQDRSQERKGQAAWMEQWVLRGAVTPRPAALSLVSPRRPGEQGCESKCVKKPRSPSQNLETAAMEGLGAIGHGPLAQKHLQYITFGVVQRLR